MRTLLAALLAAAATHALAAGEERWIDANTRIREEPRLRQVTGTDTAGAGASMSMEEKHKREAKAGAGGPEEPAPLQLKKQPSAKKPRR
jgi:hypothetical protein